MLNLTWFSQTSEVLETSEVFREVKEIRFFEKIGFLATEVLETSEVFREVKEIRFFQKIGFLATKVFRDVIYLNVYSLVSFEKSGADDVKEIPQLRSHSFSLFNL